MLSFNDFYLLWCNSSTSTIKKKEKWFDSVHNFVDSIIRVWKNDYKDK